MLQGELPQTQKSTSFSSECGQKVTRLRTDNGGIHIQWISRILESSRSPPWDDCTSHTAAKCCCRKKNRRLLEAARSVLSHAKLPNMSWAEAVAAAANIQNRLPTSVLKKETPCQRWRGKKPDMSHRRVFGCAAYAHVPHRKKKTGQESCEASLHGTCRQCKGPPSVGWRRKKNPVNHSRTKHKHIHCHYIHECVQNVQIPEQYCPTADMKADVWQEEGLSTSLSLLNMLNMYSAVYCSICYGHCKHSKRKQEGFIIVWYYLWGQAVILVMEVA